MARTATSLALSTSCEGQEKRQGSAGRTGRYRSAGELATPGAQGCLDPLGPIAARYHRGWGGGGQTRGRARATGGGGPGGYSRVRSYFHTPFASPSARRSPPPPLPLPPAPGRRPFFTTSQCPPPAVLAAMSPTLPPRSPPGAFRSGADAPRSATSPRRASRRVTPPARQLGTCSRWCLPGSSTLGFGAASGAFLSQTKQNKTKPAKQKMLR